MIEVLDGRLPTTDQIAGARQRLVLRPDRWVNEVAVSEQKPTPPKQNSEADENAVRGAAELIHASRGSGEVKTVNEAFLVWKGLCEQLAAGEPVSIHALRAAAADVARLIGPSSENHAQQFFGEVEPGAGGAFFG